MQVHLSGSDFDNIQVFAGAEVAELKPQTDENGQVRLTNGKPTYGIPGVLVYERTASGKDRQVRTAYVKVLNAPKQPISRFEQLSFEGEVTAKLWVSDGQLGLSITADHVKQSKAE
ncbi:hypothetical protein [Bifidobacterium crudilactis]|jgi:hypothetical protein|uniref:Uncharacterized protein n=1 Tax=Bifidobacterium crudilactis TaxID=327277 RepID=A0A971CYT1_9BIFI|nr:hypothetical protein [Bifidobacterium crudilactis]MCI1868330.1 hypothetical protein [Bifidobacterium crudilactis]MDN5972132.1 hypothetical protein [Bifidobacterium crudilactis]MDN6000015.1 hypothetical protein [Bifidobacterium crudilactis]MDN6466607.1 hypothetical protein [Bifidobacterium crudilactis]MDN6557956.1 hypothetical protein [Bifidobacterium crudilactis]